tara:strand:- start:38 stop:241 length:204 start_codon:yes stop_codon:yes gene_type:complete
METNPCKRLYKRYENSLDSDAPKPVETNGFFNKPEVKSTDNSEARRALEIFRTIRQARMGLKDDRRS